MIPGCVLTSIEGLVYVNDLDLTTEILLSPTHDFTPPLEFSVSTQKVFF